MTETLGGGLYMRPTVLTDVTHDMQIMRDETFGPMLPVMRYRSIDEAVALANDTEYGLTASVIAGTEAEALPIAERINAGSVFVQDTSHLRETAQDRPPTASALGSGGSRTGPTPSCGFCDARQHDDHGAPASISTTSQESRVKPGTK